MFVAIVKRLDLETVKSVESSGYYLHLYLAEFAGLFKTQHSICESLSTHIAAKVPSVMTAGRNVSNCGLGKYA